MTRKIPVSLLALFMALAMSLACFAAVTPKGEFPVVDAPITLKIAMPVNAKVIDIHTNQLTLWLEEKTGIDFDIIALSPTDTSTQVNMMMTSGDLPDMFMGYNFPYDMMASYAEAGLLAPLDEYIEKYGDELPGFIEEWGDDPMPYVTYDGHVYAMPTGNNLITDIYGGYYNRISTVYLENLGLECPDTLDEFYELLVAIRDQDANGNGDPDDEIPFISDTGDWENMMFRTISNAFQYTDVSTYLKVNDGEVSFIANNDLFKDTVLFLKKLLDEGLLDPASFTQDQSAITNLIAQDITRIGVYGVGYFFSVGMDKTTDWYKSIRIIDNLEGPNGYVSTMYQLQNVNRCSVITTACKNPDAAYRLLDFLLSEEAATAVRIGFEGQQWEKATEGMLGRDGKPAWFNLITPQEWVQASTNVIWDNASMIHGDIMNHVVADMSNPNTTVLLINEYDLPGERTYEWLPQLIMDVETSTEYNELRVLIRDYVAENVAKFALSYRPIEEWDAYVAELNDMGLERYVELAQSAYDDMLK